MKKLILLFLPLFIIACAKETPDCKLEFADDAEPLSSSLEIVNHYNFPDELRYEDNEGNVHLYTNRNDEGRVMCLHEWVCEEDESVRETYFAGRPTYSNHLSTTNHDHAFIIDKYASLNEAKPLIYGDVLTISFKIEGEFYGCVLKYVIDPRTDDDLSNDDLIYNTQLTLNGTVFNDVYSAVYEEYNIYYNVEFGLLGYGNNNTGEYLYLQKG